MSDPSVRIGWVGLGAMGGPMAAWAASEGLEVKAFDVDSSRARSIAATSSLVEAGSVAEAATDVDVLVVMVATPEQVETVLLGPGGAADALGPGSVVLMMATVGPAAVESWVSALASRDVTLVDAPVSGGVARAGTGDLLVMVSGPEESIKRCAPLLDCLAASAPTVGFEAGAGQKVKLVNQLLCGLHIAVAGEALSFAEAIGLDPADCLEVLRHGAATSFMLEDRGPRMTEAEFEPARSALDIFVKDMGLVLGAAREASFPVPLAATAEQLYLTGKRDGLGRKDDSSIVTVQQGRTAPPA